MKNLLEKYFYAGNGRTDNNRLQQDTKTRDKIQRDMETVFIPAGVRRIKQTKDSGELQRAEKTAAANAKAVFYDDKASYTGPYGIPFAKEATGASASKAEEPAADLIPEEGSGRTDGKTEDGGEKNIYKIENKVYNGNKTNQNVLDIYAGLSERDKNTFKNVRKRYETEDSIDLQDQKNKDVLHLVQGLAGIDKSDTVTQDLLNTLQNYMFSGNTDFEFDDYCLTKDNFNTLLQAAQDVKKNPHIDKNAAKAIEFAADFLVNPEAAVDMLFMEVMANSGNVIGDAFGENMLTTQQKINILSKMTGQLMEQSKK